MNSRERFVATCRFEPVDRPFRWDSLGAWDSTIERWEKEGMPHHEPEQLFHAHFGFDRSSHNGIPDNGNFEKILVGCSTTQTPFEPQFEAKTIEERDGFRIFQDEMGVVMRMPKEHGDMTMPEFLRYPVHTREDLDALMPRLDPDSPGRFPPDWPKLAEKLRARDYPLHFMIAGAFALPRNLMGVQRSLMTYYDDPEMMHFIGRTWVSFYTRLLERVCEGVKPDWIFLWEDMAFKNGPLISPECFRQFCLPYYKELLANIKSLGIDIIFVDSDGDVRKLIPLWIEGGVTALLPFEVQAGCDVVAIRKEYGRTFAILGGINKRELTKDLRAIDAEVARVVPPMLAEGGYIPCLDHSAPPDIPYKNFKYYVDAVRKVASGYGQKGA